MTEAQLRGVWERWMHRSDLTADLDVILELSAVRVANRLMYTPEMTQDQMIDAAPQMWVHAGLVELHDLAQDDEGMMREQGRFEAAAQDHHLRRSQDNFDAVSSIPYLGEF